MKRMTIFPSVVILLSMADACLAGDSQYLQQENTQLRRRIERIENAIEELKRATGTSAQSAGSSARAPFSDRSSSNKDMESLKQENVQLKQRLEKLESALAGSGNKASPAAASAYTKNETTPAKAPSAPSPSKAGQTKPPSASAPGKATETKAQAPAAKPQPAPVVPTANDKKSVLSSLDIELYGIIKADASYDSSRANPGNYVLFLDSEATRDNDNEFNLTANQTRLGMRIIGPATETLKTSGLVEIDFFGNNAPENKARPQMRLAYLVLDWPACQFSILAGQAADIISPLVPYTLNYTVLWDAGNIGYRRPQIRLTQSIPLGERSSVKFECGAVRTIGRTDPTGSETGEDAGFPTSQARLSVTFPFFGPKPTTIGVSGHIGHEEFDTAATGRNVDFDTQSINLDVTQPVCSWLTILGELFSGQDLDQYFGGIGQGINTTTLQEIHANGGWIALSLGPWSQWSFNLGAGLDEVDRDDVANGARTKNSSIFGNVLYAFNKSAQVGLELSHWDTKYRGQDDAEDFRAQASFIYKF